MLYSYYIGLDLGQATDYTALTIVEEPVWTMRQWMSPAALSPLTLQRELEKNFYEGRPPNPVLQLRHIERFDLGTPYPHIVNRVSNLMRREPLRSRACALLIDKTGVGAAVVDMVMQAWLNPIAVTIHGGSSITRDPQRNGYRVPKRDLVGAVQVPLQNRRLQIARSLPLAGVLKKELMEFRIKIDPATAHDSYEHWRENSHDDLVLATAMPLWFRQWWQENLELAHMTRPESFRDGEVPAEEIHELMTYTPAEEVR